MSSNLAINPWTGGYVRGPDYNWWLWRGYWRRGPQRVLEAHGVTSGAHCSVLIALRATGYDGQTCGWVTGYSAVGRSTVRQVLPELVQAGLATLHEQEIPGFSRPRVIYRLTASGEVATQQRLV